MRKTLDSRRSLRARAFALCAVAAIFLAADNLEAAGPGAPPRPRGAPGAAITASEAKALAHWALARPEVAARLKNHRVRLLKAGLAEPSKDGKSAAKAVLSFRDYDAGVVQQVIVDMDSGSVEVGEVARVVQPSPEEIAEGMAVVVRDPSLATFVADPTLVLMGGFHVKSPYADDPCSREVCLEFGFMKPGRDPAPEDVKVAPRRVIVNLSRLAVVNRDFRTDGGPDAAAPRMTAPGGER